MPQRRCAAAQLSKTALLAAAVALTACGRGAAPSPQDTPPGAPPDAPSGGAATTHFTVRGRWPSPERVTWRAEPRGAPVPDAAWQAAVARACDAWTATGRVAFARAAAGEDADVTLGWRRGHHGACEPFGVSTSVAHAGPVAVGTFVHFDAERDWATDDAEGGAGYSLFGAALHELGHVLGLGHSLAEGAVMQTGVVRASPLSTSERFGLQSLYGGGRDDDGDLRVTTGSGRVLCTLRGVAPAGASDFACFDVDGDRQREVVVWRTDRDGDGVLMVYYFDPRGLVRTTGPHFGAASPAANARNGVVEAGGARLFVTSYANGRVVARRFDERGLLQPHPGTSPGPASPQPHTGDVDGDREPETVTRVRRS